jgi:peptide/nickel transport system permease protein
MCSTEKTGGKEKAPTWFQGPWPSFLIRRLVGLAAALLALLIITFFIVHLIPGDPAVSVAGADATHADIERVREELGLNQPILVQFWQYLSGIFTGNLGNSFMWHIPVQEVVMQRLPYTLSVALIGVLVVLIVSVPLGMLVGISTRGGRHPWVSNLFGVLTGLFSSVPPYVLATLLIIVFAISAKILPPAYSSNAGAASWVLPIIAIAIGPICTISRTVRRESAVVLEQDYVRTARGWRLPPARTYLKYVLPNLLTTTLTLSGLILTSMLGSALVIETVFAWPGLGQGVVQAVLNKDYPVIRAIILFIGVIAGVMNLLIDVILGIIDPRTLGGKK